MLYESAERDDVSFLRCRVQIASSHGHLSLPIITDSYARPVSRIQRRHGYSHSNVEVGHVLWQFKSIQSPDSINLANWIVNKSKMWFGSLTQVRRNSRILQRYGAHIIESHASDGHHFCRLRERVPPTDWNVGQPPNQRKRFHCTKRSYYSLCSVIEPKLILYSLSLWRVLIIKLLTFVYIYCILHR